METLQSLLLDPLTIQLISTHPNTYAVDPTSLRLPHVDDWLDLVQFYATGCPASRSRIPDELVHLITSIRQHQLPRNPVFFAEMLRLRSEQGMSPKKAHEVSRMATYIVDLVSRLPSSSTGPRIVDIGAGQGYLTRALKSHLPRSHILALDADIEQTKGAQKWEARLLPKEARQPPIDHKVVFISSDSLLDAVDEWVDCDSETEQEDVKGSVGEKEPIPVLFVALHACGSLTPDILRAFIKAANHPAEGRKWYPVGVVVVGCCYNLMNPSDYPPSTKHLPVSAYHLAAQMPSQWLLRCGSDADPLNMGLDPTVALSIRKVTWRALLSRALETALPRHSAFHSESSFEVASPSAEAQLQSQTPTKSSTVPARWSRRPQSQDADANVKYVAPESGTGFTLTMNRLGRLRDSVYTSWNTFLHAAEDKLGVVFDEREFDREGNDDEGKSETKEGDGRKGHEVWREQGRRVKVKNLENELVVLHIMRCLLGPAIESAILSDRITWVRKELGISSDCDQAAGVEEDRDTKSERRLCFSADLINLFDQATGSGRNVALVVLPLKGKISIPL